MSIDVTRHHHVSLKVDELEPAVAFYSDRLGMRPTGDRPTTMGPGEWLRSGTAELHLVVGDVPTDAGQHFALAVRDLDAAVSELRAAGCTLRGPAPVGLDNDTQWFVADPSGNWIELRQERT